MRRVLLIGLVMLAGCAGKQTNEPMPRPECDMKDPACVEAVAKWEEARKEPSFSDRTKWALIASGLILGIAVLGAGWANQ
jgi:hypothetical protein